MDLINKHLSYEMTDVLATNASLGKGSVITDFFNNLYLASAGKIPVDTLFVHDRFCATVSGALMGCLLNSPEKFESEAAVRAAGIKKSYGLIQKYLEMPNDYEAMVKDGDAICAECKCDFIRELVFAVFDTFGRR